MLNERSGVGGTYVGRGQFQKARGHMSGVFECQKRNVRLDLGR